MTDAQKHVSNGRPFSPGFAVRLPLDFEVAELIAEVCSVGSEPWRVHFNTGYHDGGWTGLVLQSARGNHETLYAPVREVSPDSVAPTDAAARCPALMRTVVMFQCQVKAARVLRLAAGSVIREHNDPDLLWQDGEARLHIPLQTNADVAFYVDGQRVRMQVGECWYLDLSKPHRVHNRGTTDRLHLVLDCTVNQWLSDQVQRGTAPTTVSMIDETSAQFQAFREAVFADPALQAELRACQRMDDLLALAVTRGNALGFHFLGEEVNAQVNQARRDWMEQWIR